ncbi:MAG: 5-formyltetrahydrofolate cyclo-ligase [Lachnospiraceae bacterium]|nr:5-formyltetrahydrofolate cyclo-ligase [Lachnospiraceae bacterium]
MNLQEQKRWVRKKAAQKLNQYSDEWIQKESRKIQDHVLESEGYRRADTIFCYVSFAKEVNVIPIIEDALRTGKRVGVPLCIGKGMMEVREIRSMDELQPGAYGILEPKKGTRKVDKHEIQYAVIPCVTCDKLGNRMGHGAGYYDRYLSDADFIKTILCFEEIMVQEIPTDLYDVRMDYVISQNGAIKVV